MKGYLEYSKISSATRVRQHTYIHNSETKVHGVRMFADGAGFNRIKKHVKTLSDSRSRQTLSFGIYPDRITALSVN